MSKLHHENSYVNFILCVIAIHVLGITHETLVNLSMPAPVINMSPPPFLFYFFSNRGTCPGLRIETMHTANMSPTLKPSQHMKLFSSLLFFYNITTLVSDRSGALEIVLFGSFNFDRL
jgi:hypothetical protein